MIRGAPAHSRSNARIQALRRWRRDLFEEQTSKIVTTREGWRSRAAVRMRTGTTCRVSAVQNKGTRAPCSLHRVEFFQRRVELAHLELHRARLIGAEREDVRPGAAECDLFLLLAVVKLHRDRGHGTVHAGGGTRLVDEAFRAEIREFEERPFEIARINGLCAGCRLFPR